MLKKVNFNLNQIIASDLFLGYQVSNWNPRVNYFLLGSYKGTNLFNVNHTYFLLKSVMFLLSDLLSKNGRIWLVNENFSSFYKSREFYSIAKSFPELTFFNRKWCKGTLSNFKYVSLVKPRKFPHILLTPNLSNNYFVINEAFLINIPVISIIDSIDNPQHVTYAIPGNSKSIKSALFFYLMVSKVTAYSRSLTAASFISFSLEKLRKRINLFTSSSLRSALLKHYSCFFSNNRYLFSKNIYLANFKFNNLKFFRYILLYFRTRPTIISPGFLFLLFNTFFINVLKNSLLNLFSISGMSFKVNLSLFKVITRLTI